MKLNNTSYVHKRIRLLCFQLEQFSGLKLVTNLSEEFKEVKFMNPLSYIVLDYKNEVIFSMCYKMSNTELKIAEEIILYCGWLWVFEEYYRKKNKIRNKKKSSKKN